MWPWIGHVWMTAIGPLGVQNLKNQYHYNNGPPSKVAQVEILRTMAYSGDILFGYTATFDTVGFAFLYPLKMTSNH